MVSGSDTVLRDSSGGLIGVGFLGAGGGDNMFVRGGLMGNPVPVAGCGSVGRSPTLGGSDSSEFDSTSKPNFQLMKEVDSLKAAVSLRNSLVSLRNRGLSVAHSSLYRADMEAEFALVCL